MNNKLVLGLLGALFIGVATNEMYAPKGDGSGFIPKKGDACPGMRTVDHKIHIHIRTPLRNLFNKVFQHLRDALKEDPEGNVIPVLEQGWVHLFSPEIRRQYLKNFIEAQYEWKAFKKSVEGLRQDPECLQIFQLMKPEEYLWMATEAMPEVIFEMMASRLVEDKRDHAVWCVVETIVFAKISGPALTAIVEGGVEDHFYIERPLAKGSKVFFTHSVFSKFDPANEFRVEFVRQD